LQPAARIRYRSAGGGRGNDGPQYPAVALAIDYILPAGFSGPLSLEITDAAGKVVRTVKGAGGGTAAESPDMRVGGGGRGRGRGAAAPMSVRAGHNRFMWDYRWADGGPLAAPGKYTVSLKPGDAPAISRTFEVLIDPGVAKDGITQADLVEQQNFLLKLRDAQAEAARLRTRVQQAMQKAGVQPPPSPGPGESPFRRAPGSPSLHPLQTLWARLVSPTGTYEQGMLIDQLGNIGRAENGADQKVGAESRRRLDDLLKEMKAIDAELAKM
jgi:hypothetical protein